MTDMTAFVSFLREEERRSYDEIISAERAVALSFYNGELYGDEEEGRSQVVTRDVSEVVDPMTVSVLRAMISGDRAVEFEHPDSKLAEQATMAVSRKERSPNPPFAKLDLHLQSTLILYF